MATTFIQLFAFVKAFDVLKQTKQARKSSEDTQVAGYARFEKVWAGQASNQETTTPLPPTNFRKSFPDHFFYQFSR